MTCMPFYRTVIYIFSMYILTFLFCFSGVVNLIIPYCKSFYSLLSICSLWGFFDAGNYVLLPVLTFDLMGPEKMTIAWGFMMAVNAISCFGPPFAGKLSNANMCFSMQHFSTHTKQLFPSYLLSSFPLDFSQTYFRISAYNWLSTLSV